MSQLEIRPVFTIAGVDRTFESKAEAQAYLRRPIIKAAMLAVTGNNSELTDWLIENQESVEMAFETGTIRRVSKSEAAKLAKACDALKLLKDNKEIAFLVDNADAIKDSFRWPSVRRMDEAEKNTAARNTLTAAANGNEDVANWILANKTAILAAYTAGQQKREVSPKAAEGLAAYRASQAAKKERQDKFVAEAIAASGKTEEADIKAVEAEALAKFRAILAEEKAAEDAAKKQAEDIAAAE